MRPGRFGLDRCSICGHPLDGGGLDWVGAGRICWTCHVTNSGGGTGTRSNRGRQAGLFDK